MQEKRPKCPDSCIARYDLVCGLDGKTYSNSCFLGIGSCKSRCKIRKVTKGRCGEYIKIFLNIRELRNYNRKLLLCPPQKHNQHFKLLFFQAYLHFGTSNLLSTYEKASAIFVVSIYLALSSLEFQRRVIQTKYTTSRF